MWVKNNCVKISKNNFKWSHNVYRWNLINSSIKARDEHIQEQSCIFLIWVIVNLPGSSKIIYHHVLKLKIHKYNVFELGKLKI